MHEWAFPLGTRPIFTEAPECSVDGPKGAEFALTCEWPDGVETTEYVTRYGAQALGFDINEAVVCLDAASPSRSAAAAADAQARADARRAAPAAGMSTALSKRAHDLISALVDEVVDDCTSEREEQSPATVVARQYLDDYVAGLERKLSARDRGPADPRAGAVTEELRALYAQTIAPAPWPAGSTPIANFEEAAIAWVRGQCAVATPMTCAHMTERGDCVWRTRTWSPVCTPSRCAGCPDARRARIAAEDRARGTQAGEGRGLAAVTISFQMSASGALRLTEVEMRALDALVGYGDDAFIAAFKERLGEAYLRHHEGGLRSFFEAVRRDVLPALALVTQARRDLGEANQARLRAAEDRARGAEGGEAERG